MTLERFAEKAFTFVQMCSTSGLINVVLRTVISPKAAFYLTLPWAGLALAYVAWPLIVRHEKRLEAFDNATGLLPLIAVGMLSFTLWVADLLARSIAIAP